jgi:4-hydroxy-3-polyprenylbenzoate decarboxylase
MAHDIPSFIREIERINQLKRIDIPVSTKLEIAEIADRVVKRAGPALLFQTSSKRPTCRSRLGFTARTSVWRWRFTIRRKISRRASAS